VIRIEPTNPEVVYVPSYDPAVVYGAWPPAYPPYAPYPAGYFAAGMFTFAAGAAVGAALWGNCNWGGGDVNINSNRSDNFTRNVNNANVANDRIQHRAQGGGGQGRNQWQHNPEHRKGVQYRDNATQQRFNKGARATLSPGRRSVAAPDPTPAVGSRAGLVKRVLGGPPGRARSAGWRGEGGVGQQGGRGEGGLGQEGARGQGGIGQQGGGGLGDRGAQASPALAASARVAPVKAASRLAPSREWGAAATLRASATAATRAVTASIDRLVEEEPGAAPAVQAVVAAAAAAEEVVDDSRMSWLVFVTMFALALEAGGPAHAQAPAPAKPEAPAAAKPATAAKPAVVPPKSFASAEEATQALVAALRAGDTKALLGILAVRAARSFLPAMRCPTSRAERSS